MLSHYLQLQNIPMWVGFNSRIFDDVSQKQKIAYLTTINESPTSIVVVKLTLDQCLQIKNECNQKYIQVTYDLAVAKEAMRIQREEAPMYKDIFIHLGEFHVEMAYFKAIGKLIDNCGISNILIDCGLIANGSINGFISGKFFSRCKYLHQLLSLVFEMLHFERFLTDVNIDIPNEIIEYLHDFSKNKSQNPLVDKNKVLQLIDLFDSYKTETLEGRLDKTSQFYALYTQAIDNYLIMNAGVRRTDLQLFMSALPKIANCFFYFNQQNYARYIVKYFDNLIKVEKTHPGLRDELVNGSFGIQRTDKSFSRQPIDLTLEQTINADAASKLTGIIHSSNSIAAGQRWARSHSLRTKIISHVMSECNLLEKQDVTNDLKKYKIKNSTAHVEKLISAIKETINPFSRELDKNVLFNISTGESATENIAFI